MIIKSMFKKSIVLSCVLLCSMSYAAHNNAKKSYPILDKNNLCPQPAEIQSTDFTAPSIWVAPPVAQSVPGQAGVGLGGKLVKELLGVEPATVNHKKGWVCVYRSEGGMSPREYENKALETVKGIPYLNKYIEKIIKFMEDAEPYLKEYPETSLGFIGYEEKTEQK